MAANNSSDPISPELIRLIKLFVAVPILLALLLSFFNDRRATNRGERDESSISDASRLYFKNVRSAYYDREVRRDANMELYRIGNRIKDTTANTLNSALIINKVKDAAYLYLEPQGKLKEVNPLPIRWIAANGDTTETSFAQGDRISHLHFVDKIYPQLKDPIRVEANIGSEWVPILSSEEERKSLRITVTDFYRLLERK